MRFVSSLVVLTGFFFVSTAFSAGSVEIDNAHAKASFPMAQTGAVYFTLRNSSEMDCTLVDVSVDEAVATEAQLHTTELKNDMMRMRELTEGLMIPAGGTKSLKPGGYHVMLLGLKKALAEGDSFPLTLTFANGDTVSADVSVIAMDTGEQQHMHQQH